MISDDSNWADHIREGIENMLSGLFIPYEHTVNTPQRVVDSYKELFSGCNQDPDAVLEEALFRAEHIDQMVTTKDLTIYSMCVHHLLPFFGHATFAYIPAEHIVGLSKIPRFIDIICKRPQIQENLSQQIVNTFQRVVKPYGCAVMIRAYHLCNLMRGAEEHEAYTETTALTGVFKTNAKAEFLQTAQDTPVWGRR